MKMLLSLLFGGFFLLGAAATPQPYLNAKGKILEWTPGPTKYLGGEPVPGTINGSDGADQISGPAGNTFKGGAGGDTYLINGPGLTIVEQANEGVDAIKSYRDFIKLPDNVENLEIPSNPGSYTAGGEGNALDNIILGGKGGQTLDGGGGDDVLVGGEGDDVFVMRRGNGSDVINDFNDGADRIRLDSYPFRTFAQVAAAMTQKGADTVIKLSTSEELILRNIDKSALNAGDFILPFEPTGLQVAFQDEFDGFNRYDSSKKTGWETRYANEGVAAYTLPTNAEQQLYTDVDFKGEASAPLGLNPFSTSNGVLNIRASRVTPQQSAKMWKYEISSGLITTRSTFGQTYGYFEMRADLPEGQGMWSAFWLLPADKTWPPEIDILESIGDDNEAFASTHTVATGTHVGLTTRAHVYDNPDGFNTYGLLWTPTELIWYVDGMEVRRSPTPADMNKPMYILANLAAGGNWAGKVKPDWQSADMKIDYIRAYRLPATASARH